MSTKYFMGHLYFQTFLTKYSGFCNVGENVKQRVNPDVLIAVILCKHDDTTTSGTWALSKFSELLRNPEDNVIMIEAQHNSPILDGKCHHTIAYLFKDFLVRSGIVPPEVSEGFSYEANN
jgi:hypothetical protein